MVRIKPEINSTRLLFQSFPIETVTINFDLHYKRITERENILLYTTIRSFGSWRNEVLFWRIGGRWTCNLHGINYQINLNADSQSACIQYIYSDLLPYSFCGTLYADWVSMCFSASVSVYNIHKTHLTAEWNEGIMKWRDFFIIHASFFGTLMTNGNGE